MSSDSHTPRFDKLRTGNYPQWRGNILALLMTRGSSRLVLGKEKKPVGKDPKNPSEAEVEAMEKWEDKALKAAGEIYLSLSDDQKTHVEECSDDPVLMWTKLESVHLQKKPGMRFNAWEEFFSIHMEENESLSSLMTRIDAAMYKVKNLRTESFTIEELDKELVFMVMIRSLPSSYSNFASSLQLLDKLDKDTLQAAFINEEALRTRSSTPGSTSVLSASTSFPFSSSTCDFCSLPGHSQTACIRYTCMKEQASKEAQEKRKQRGKGKSNASNASTAPEPSNSAAAAQEITSESAGQASVHLSSCSTLSELATHLLWTVDTGATAHMTPHKHWLRGYSPLKIPIRLANDQVVYSEGVGSVVSLQRPEESYCAK
jgi:hypothetical protein